MARRLYETGSVREALVVARDIGLAKDAADDGLLQRFCYCVPAQQTEGEDRKPHAASVARYETLFPFLTALRPEKGRVKRVGPRF